MSSSSIRANFSKFHPSIFTLLIFFNLSLIIETDAACLETTPSGAFRGVLKKSILRPEVAFCSFLGIRYGKPLRGKHRFGKPEATDSFEGVYNATSDGQKCPQISWPDGKTVGDEDCLYLNVFTPKTRDRSTKPLKPVIVYIHGGAFFEGSSSSDEISPDYLIEHDVLLVTLNYRLHVFGFLNLNVPECGGNMGLRDQTLALEWVRKHIKAFGGDPDNVTLMGQSAGAISVHLLALSPISRDLFHKTIIHSAISIFFVKENAELYNYSIDFVRDSGFSGELNHSKMLEHLQSLSTDTLLVKFAQYLQKLAKSDVTFYARSHPFWPSVDMHFGEEAFLPKSLEELGEETLPIPMMIGQTNMDGTIAFYQSDVHNITVYLQKHLDLYLDRPFTKNPQIKAKVIERVKEYYFNRTNAENLLSQSIVLITDLGLYKFYNQNARFVASYRGNKIYNYQFCYDGSFQFYKKRYLGEKYYRTVKGVSHTEDLNYVFYSPSFFPNLTLTHNDEKIIREMSKWWTNFAKTGNPNSRQKSLTWKPITPQHNSFLRIDETSRFIETRINEDRHKFWDNLPRVN